MSSRETEIFNLCDGLNEAQIRAVTHGEGPALVLAGPGSGKTTVIVKRILYLIQIQKIPPEKILVVTFTKEAALSMQRRFQTLLQPKDGLDSAPVTVPVVFGTFHSIFYHILISAHHPATEKILTPVHKNEIMVGLLKNRALRKEGHYEYETIRVQARDYLAAVGFYKNTYDRQKTERLLSAELREDFFAVFREYQEKCLAEGGLDFDDMVYQCRELLTNDSVTGKYWQERFSHILVDEFQDINPMQYEVLKVLGAAHRNLFVVGDEDQAIYGFRGADPGCVRRFAQEYGAKQILLNANYRSTSDIVDFAETVISENKTRFLANKAVYAAGQNAQLTDSVKMHCFESRQQEMAFLVDALEGTSEECGVLFRTNRAMQELAVILNRKGIPFVMKEKTGNPYEHFVIRDILAYLKLAAGDRHRELFLRIMNKPVRYLNRECAGESAVMDFERISGQNAKARNELQILKQQLQRMKGMPPGLAISYVCKAIGYENYLRAQKGAGEHLEEWLEMLRFAREDAAEYATVAEWEASFQKWNGGEKNERNMVEETDRHIWLMTVHGSKGLEFEHVYLPDCNEKVYPHGSLPDLEAVEEERRIFYVGMTRAKKSLELLCTTGTKERPRQMSRFLNPVIPHLAHLKSHRSAHQTHSCQDTRQMRP